MYRLKKGGPQQDMSFSRMRYIEMSLDDIYTIIPRFLTIRHPFWICYPISVGNRRLQDWRMWISQRLLFGERWELGCSKPWVFIIVAKWGSRCIWGVGRSNPEWKKRGEARKLRIQLSKLGSENDGTIKSWDLTELGVFDFEYTPKIAILMGCGSAPFVWQLGFLGFLFV